MTTDVSPTASSASATGWSWSRRPTPPTRALQHTAATVRRQRPGCDSPYVVDGALVYVDDIDAHHARAVAAGAPTLSEIEDGPARLYRTEDLEGHRWMFMQRT